MQHSVANANKVLQLTFHSVKEHCAHDNIMNDIAYAIANNCRMCYIIMVFMFDLV